MDKLQDASDFMIPVTRAQLLSLAPNAKDVYLAAFDLAPAVLPQYGITTPLPVAHFMAQVLHESGALTIVSESLNYTHPERLMEVWPSRFKSVAMAQPFVRNPSKLAEMVYGGRMGNVNPGDGARFIGRGLLQLTGRESYLKFGKIVGADLEGNPDLAADARFALAIAAAEWQASNCNAFADHDDVRAVTRAINGGLNGFEERKAWLVKTKQVWAP
jgi:putative chitinase